MFKRYLLSSVAAFAPPTEGGSGPDTGDDRIPEPTLDDDETVGDPEGESDDAGDGDDQDDDDDQGDDQDDDDQGGEGDDPPQRQQSRGDRRIAAINADRRRLAEENARVTRQLDELRRQPAQAPSPVETPAQRAERMALMSPEDRIQEMVSDALRANEQKTTLLTNQIMDQSDSATFQAQTAANPLLKKLAPEVERRLADLRSRGQNLPRSVVATYLIGERVLAQQGKAKPGAQQRRRQQEARPVNGGSDVRGDRRQRARQTDTAADMEARFGDVPI